MSYGHVSIILNEAFVCSLALVMAWRRKTNCKKSLLRSWVSLQVLLLLPCSNSTATHTRWEQNKIEKTQQHPVTAPHFHVHQQENERQVGRGELLAEHLPAWWAAGSWEHPPGCEAVQEGSFHSALFLNRCAMPWFYFFFLWWYLHVNYRVPI